MNPARRAARWLDIETDFEKPESDRATASGLSSRAIAGGRIDGRKSFDRPEDQFASGLSFFSSFSTDSYWESVDLSPNNLKKLNVHRVVELLADSSPEMSKALFDFILMGNPGFTLKAFTPGTETEDVKATKALAEMMKTLKRHYGSPKVVFNRLFMAAFMRGKIFAELVLADSGRRFVDIATPDPAFLSFRRVSDPERGPVWQIGQWHGTDFVVLEGPTIRYIPIHPFPGKIDGRPLVHPAIFICVFLMSMLHDLRRVIQQQGYPRIDLKIIFEKLKDQIPNEVRTKPRELKKWADDVVAEIKNVFSQLKPDDTYVHSDAIEVGRPVGTLDDSSLGAVDGLIKACERMATRALKSMPLNMGTTDGVSEANANRQWEMYAALCKSIQQDVETAVGDLLQFGLEGQGIIADVQLRFAELRAAELLRDAQVLLIKTTIARALYDNGIISQDEQAQLAIDKVKADQPAPRVNGSQSGVQPSGIVGGQPDPGSTRTAQDALREMATRLLQMRNGSRTPTLPEIEETMKLFTMFAPRAAQDLLSAEPLEQ